ncbi:MAG: Fic family protein [Methanosarcinales archaeon]|nr:MAG: Fic family protein [Methanosarcinales archaeon]
MYVEKRKTKYGIKYYLVHSYRDQDKVKKIRRYLGKDLSRDGLETAKKKAEKSILEVLEELNTRVFLFSLTKKQVEALNKYDKKLKIIHLDQKDWQRFTEEFVYNTNAIEGSTVAEDEVPEILRKKQATNAEELETKGVAKAVEYIKKTKEDLSLGLIKKIHKLCFEGSKDFAGEFRTLEVVIKSSKGEVIHAGVLANELMDALKDLVDWHKENKSKFKPLVLSAIIHNQFEYIHPFQDGNGRVGRLLLNFILIKNKYPPINISIQDREEYYATLQKYSKNQDLKQTVKFLIKQYKKTLKKAPTKRRDK